MRVTRIACLLSNTVCTCIEFVSGVLLWAQQIHMAARVMSTMDTRNEAIWISHTQLMPWYHINDPPMKSNEWNIWFIAIFYDFLFPKRRYDIDKTNEIFIERAWRWLIHYVVSSIIQSCKRASRMSFRMFSSWLNKLYFTYYNLSWRVRRRWLSLVSGIFTLLWPVF